MAKSLYAISRPPFERNVFWRTKNSRCWENWMLVIERSWEYGGWVWVSYPKLVTFFSVILATCSRAVSILATCGRAVSILAICGRAVSILAICSQAVLHWQHVADHCHPGNMWPSSVYPGNIRPGSFIQAICGRAVSFWQYVAEQYNPGNMWPSSRILREAIKN